MLLPSRRVAARERLVVKDGPSKSRTVRFVARRKGLPLPVEGVPLGDGWF